MAGFSGHFKHNETDSRRSYGARRVLYGGTHSAGVTRVELRESASLIYCNTPSRNYPSGRAYTRLPPLSPIFPSVPRHLPVAPTGYRCSLLSRGEPSTNRPWGTIDTRAALLCRTRVTTSSPTPFFHVRSSCWPTFTRLRDILARVRTREFVGK